MLRLLARGGRRLVVALVATVVVGAAIPPAVTLATGALVGGIPEAVRQGRGSLAAGDVLAAAGGTYAELYSIQARAYG